MKKLLSLLAALVVAAGLRAETDSAPKSSYSITTDFVYVSEYIFRGIEQQDAALQPAVTFTRETLSLGVWSSQALSNKTLAWSQGSEIDVWGSYGIPFGKATLTLGGTAYLYPSARPSFGEPDSTWELSAGISGPLGPLTGSATYFHDFVLDANTFQFNLAHSLSLAGGTLDFSGFYGLNDIADGNGDLPGTGGIDYKYFGVGAAFTYKLTNTTALKLSLNYVDVDDLPGAPSNLWASVGFTAGL
jgi:hypothetical protein